MNTRTAPGIRHAAHDLDQRRRNVARRRAWPPCSSLPPPPRPRRRSACRSAFTPVPLVMQDMVVLLGGAALGSRLGMAAQVLYLLAGIVRASRLRRLAGAAAGAAAPARTDRRIPAQLSVRRVPDRLSRRARLRSPLLDLRARDGGRPGRRSSLSASPGWRCSRGPPARLRGGAAAPGSIRSSSAMSSRSSSAPRSFRVSGSLIGQRDRNRRSRLLSRSIISWSSGCPSRNPGWRHSPSVAVHLHAREIASRTSVGEQRRASGCPRVRG